MEEFSSEEKAILAAFFTNVNKPVFALKNMPEVVKAALFARYSRSSKSVRRLFLDEFADTVVSTGMSSEDPENAKKLFERVFVEYGDDSVAQLGGAHVACEGISNIATKALERGRLMSYLEQSTRYIRYDKPRSGRYLYMCPPEIEDGVLREKYNETMDFLFESYRFVVDQVFELLGGNQANEPALKRTLMARALDAARGILPAATISNVGVYGSGQAYEMLLMRLMAHPLGEIQMLGEELLGELQLVIPSFVKRVDRPDRGGAWVEYMANSRRDTAEMVASILDAQAEYMRTEPLGLVGDDTTGVHVQLVDWDSDGEQKILSAIMQPHTHISDDDIWRTVLRLGPSQKKDLLRAYVGDRKNRRHRPGRAFEHANYMFEVVVDYGAFRDLQRHRMLTIDWQTPTVANGYIQPALVDQAGAAPRFADAMERATELHHVLLEHHPEVASYATCMAHRVRFSMRMNARELMHLVELRSTPAGHPAYRTVAQKMFAEISTTAQHHLVSEALSFVDLSSNEEASRLEAEKATEEKKQNPST